MVGNTLSTCTLGGTIYTCPGYGTITSVLNSVLKTGFDDSISGWGNCGLSCAGGTGAGTGTQTVNNTTPSLDSKSMKISVTGPALSAGQTTNYLWYYNAGANSTSTSFISTWHVNIPSTSLIQELEYDTKQFISGHRWFWGSECNPGGVWQIWNQLAGAWVTTSVPCTLTANTWHTIIWKVHRVPGETACSGQPCDYYDSLSVDGTVYTGFTPQPSGPSGDADNTGTDTQIDLNSTGGTASEYLDEMSFSQNSGTIVVTGNFEIAWDTSQTCTTSCTTVDQVFGPQYTSWVDLAGTFSSTTGGNGTAPLGAKPIILLPYPFVVPPTNLQVLGSGKFAGASILN